MNTEKTAVPSGKHNLCPIRHMLNIFGGKWKLPIVCMLSRGGPMRYSAIKRRLENITNVMLSQSLKDLEASGLVRRKQYNEVPPRVEYSLTDKGMSILPTLESFVSWGIDDISENTSCNPNCLRCTSAD